MGYFILTLIAIIIILLVIHIINDDSSLIFVTIIITYILSVSIYCYFDDGPKAIDVYRNKTNLKISYIDSVAVDSVVVFKQLN